MYLLCNTTLQSQSTTKKSLKKYVLKIVPLTGDHTTSQSTRKVVGIPLHSTTSYDQINLCNVPGHFTAAL